MRAALLALVLALSGCASAPSDHLHTRFATPADFPEMSDEDREMWEQGRQHQPQCVMDEDGQETCE